MLAGRLSHHLDWLLIGALLLLCTTGLAMLYSITGGLSPLFYRQLTTMGLGVVALAVCLSIDYRTLADHAHVLYLALLAALIYVLVFGAVSKGAQRWIELGSFTLQPSEFAKLGVALVLARFFGELERRVPTLGDLVIGAGFALLPAVLIYLQPDLGTAVTIGTGFLAIVFVAGLRLKVLGVALAVALLAAPAVWLWGLQPYQKTRIETFLNPEQDPLGDGYQQIQARVTAGSGGLWGKGFARGTQGQFRFLPEAQTDFVFSVLAEEQGFSGVIVVLGLYLFVIVRSLEAARLAKDRLGTFLVVGVLAGFTFQAIYSATMAAGLAPVKGLPLPLMSYGGSSVIATLAGFGLILNVRMRRFTN